jgi:dTDP-4-dehydrorhamnose reductase
MVYLLGASGYVGQAFQNLLSKKGVPFRSLSRSQIDYTNDRALSDIIRVGNPQFLINAAGYTGKPNVDACEDHKAECLDGNASLPGRIAKVCTDLGVPWGHVSSGCIYSGARADGEGFTESDEPNFTFRQNNCSFYSGTKALGEELLAKVPNIYIWRLRIPFDCRDNSRNYLSKLMRYQRLLDATNSISQLQEFVSASWECWEKRVPFGTYNMTNPGCITTREVVGHILKSGVRTKEYCFFENELEFMANAAITPRSNCIIDSSKLMSIGIKMTEVNEAVMCALENWQEESR